MQRFHIGTVLKDILKFEAVLKCEQSGLILYVSPHKKNCGGQSLQFVSNSMPKNPTAIPVILVALCAQIEAATLSDKRTTFANEPDV